MKKWLKILLIVLFWGAVAIFGISRTKKEGPAKSFEKTPEAMEAPRPPENTSDSFSLGGDETPASDPTLDLGDTVRLPASGEGAGGRRP